LEADVELQQIQMHGYWVNAVSADDVEYLEFEAGLVSIQRKFREFPVSGAFKVSFPMIELRRKL
jgi:hypothetical protein